MKVIPVAQGTVQTQANDGRSASADKIARAKATFQGQDPNQAQTQQNVPRSAIDTPRAIKMKTNVTPASRGGPEAIEAAPAAEIDSSESTTQATSEVNKPLDPQIVELQKKARAVQVKEAAIQKREEALAAKEASGKTFEAEIQAEIDSDPFEFMAKRGWDFPKLTEAAKRLSQGAGPALTKVESELRREIKSLKEALDSQKQGQTDAQKSAFEAGLDRSQKEADRIVAEDDEFQTIRETESSGLVRKLIKHVYETDGEILDVREALEIVEADLVAQGLKFAKSSKIQAQAQQSQTPVNQGQQTRQMRTLTSRDSVTPAMTAKERAIAAFWGKKTA